MSFESLKNTVAKELSPGDFAEGFIHSAFEQPWNAIQQLRGEKLHQSEHNDSLASKAGNIAGFIAEFTVLAKLTGGPMNKLLGKAATTALGSAAKMFVAGGIHGGLLTPGREDRSLLQGRLENAAVSASTFAVMGGLARRMELSGIITPDPFKAKIAIGAISGGAGGVVEAFGRTYAAEHRAPTFREVVNSTTEYAVFGAGFGAFEYGIAKGGDKVANSPVGSAYYRAKWALSDAQVEAKRMTYAVLNKYNMRHPLQRLGDYLHGTDAKLIEPRPQLTVDNNPATIFERELPGFYRQIEAKEAEIARTPRNEQREVWEQEKEIQADFAYKLLRIWHGTAEQPGMKSFTDAELATANVSVERVAQIRKALTSTANAGFREASPMTQALADLAQIELPARAEQSHGLAHVLGTAKERFFQFDESAMGKILSLRREHHWAHRHPLTPIEWMPFEPSAKLPNLFHASVSPSLEPIFIERGMLPARELRIRGIEQKTGESATEDNGRRVISLTRDFSEAFCYQRHSPEYLTSYPVVFGVSRDVAARARYAGMLEPGEIVVDKLSLGQNWLTRLGLRRPEITHIFVPNREVASVANQLSARRIKGVDVVGFNDLPTPHWNPLPKEVLEARW